MSVRSALAASVLAVGVLACKGHEFEPREDAERLQEAATVYRPDMFDTITWADTSRMWIEGSAVWAANCRDCHGPTGQGGTDYADSRDLEVPSLVREGWPYARIEDLRRTIFTGHPRGMPTHGIAGLAPREIDAVAHYLNDQLRPEMAEAGRDASR